MTGPAAHEHQQRPPRDIDLIGVELGVIWRLDERGRLPGPEDVVIGVAADGMIAAVSRDVPAPLADRLLDLIARATPAAPPGDRPPAVLERCRALLGGEGVTVSGGPSYLVSPPVRFDAGVEVLCSGDPADVRRARPLPRPEGWEPEEWETLIGGGEGAPWAMVVENGQMVALCHTARLTPAGAEAGTWTSPSHRGRGYAAATTAAWAGHLPGIHVFYSTSAGNHSSRRVAARLGLRPLGWFWKLTA
ncbi:Acetyltransferase (GNAT) domain-containing protein [Nonomuraea solani]|uniref:Acetyltransferase (GNAT) domain-containing protein n=1 Tax=Nonomuraea solani TaxID=1144553 RepID=A0A1H6DJB3_9ACTN|nr:GNAT family N-acetyltransferase [Nonomuraea solani]SEG85348.1 Acetyltransferase (GNAT) domain-containing protein [Nonomuraea solani]